MLSRTFLLLNFLLLIWVNPAYALDVPKLTSPVVDLANAISATDKTKISASLVQFQKQYGPQLQVLIVPSLEGESIEGFSIKVVDKWQLGQKGKDDGVLLLVAIQDRQVRIEVGRGLEGDLPDALAGRIIRAGILPFFKQGQTSAGILVGLNMIAESIGGKLENIPQPRLRKTQRSKEGNLGFILFIIFFLIGPSLFGRRRRGGIGSALLSGLLLGGMMGSGRGGSGGFGGGGFSGGGGGGFSGGGASGSW